MGVAMATRSPDAMRRQLLLLPTKYELDNWVPSYGNFLAHAQFAAMNLTFHLEIGRRGACALGCGTFVPIWASWGFWFLL